MWWAYFSSDGEHKCGGFLDSKLEMNAKHVWRISAGIIALSGQNYKSLSLSLWLRPTQDIRAANWKLRSVWEGKGVGVCQCKVWFKWLKSYIHMNLGFKIKNYAIKAFQIIIFDKIYFYYQSKKFTSNID
jgi:hypothetical protein